jgi:integrase/recombinase XerD
MQQIIIYTPMPRSQRFKLYIPYNLKEERIWLKSQNTAFYHPQQRLWSLVNTPENKKLVAKAFKGKYTIESPENKEKLIKTLNLTEAAEAELTKCNEKFILKSLSESTIKSYLSALGYFFSFFNKHHYPDLEKSEIESYVYHLKSKYQISDTAQNTVINAIKAYYEHVLGKPREYYDIQRPNRTKSLPNVFSKEEVLKILQATSNIKHKAILLTIYSAGLRISEAINLRSKDILSDEGCIFVKDAKGKKDRKSVLSPLLLEVLRKYYKLHKPSYWLFEGQDGGKYSAKSIQNILRKAIDSSGVNPWGTVHTLRHSFATGPTPRHLLQEGVNLRVIQKMLGHSSSKTTEVYTHVLSVNNKVVKSPLDYLENFDIFDEK